jgi:hypothetical protein
MGKLNKYKLLFIISVVLNGSSCSTKNEKAGMILIKDFFNEAIIGEKIEVKKIASQEINDTVYWKIQVNWGASRYNQIYYFKSINDKVLLYSFDSEQIENTLNKKGK